MKSVKILIKAFMNAGFIAMLLGIGAINDNSVTTIIVPLMVAILGIGIMAFGGYLESYLAWYEERRIK